MRRKEAAAAAAANEGSWEEAGGGEKGEEGEERGREKVRSERGPRLRRDSTTDYAADNSSEHSSSATPLTQSPRHRLLATHQDSKGSDPALARAPSGEPSTGDSPRFKARSAVRMLLDSKRESGGSSVLSAVASGIVSGSQADLPGPSEISPASLEDVAKRRHEASLRQHSFYQLRVHLKRGHDLVAKDTRGTSDPYVKFKVGGRLLYKSKTIYRDLNPTWDESFVLPIEDPFQPIHVKVFDYDWGLQDDFMGSAYLDLTTLEFNKATEITLSLSEAGKTPSNKYMGTLSLTVTLIPRTQEDKDQYFQRNTKLSDVNRRLKSQIWSSVVTIVLIEGKNLVAMDMDGLSDPYVKFRLGNEKYKTKTVYKSLNPNWLEQFDLHLYDDQSQDLEITVWDKDSRTKDDFMGRCVIDLSKLEREKTHRIWKDLQEGSGSLFLLLTISGTTASETISDLSSYEENPVERRVIQNRYTLRNTLHNWKDVGHLTVKVYKAQGLVAADLGGKSDPFCVLELINARLQTQTEYKTLTPSWHKIFTFNVKDIHSVLEVTVWDEDRDHKVEFLGKVAIPLLRIRNGEKRWYALKDKKLRGRAKGNFPQILLEMTVEWNYLRACIRTLNPKEEKYMQSELKFKRQVFVRNVMRLKAIIMHFIEAGKFLQGCFEWESTPRSLVALVSFIMLCHCFEPYMIPIAMLLIFLKQYMVMSLLGAWSPYHEEEEEPSGDEDDDEEDKDKEEKKSLKERLQAIQEVTQSVQNAIGYITSICESVKNTFNFTVPYLTWIAIILISMVAIVLYYIPVRYLIMAFGVNKFARKLIRPHTIPNNEILDFLSRVPDDEDLLDYRELRPHPTAERECRRDHKKKHKAS
ncbi:multiple C2 and transmembrane domain-containing protein isoform X1 [Hetaerina americana]|uniref:multiple C2 and transmembrane domain-containing protein isoform X1 n=1 Tax=Hetaerina americana TaxID=62018 RepID=UPI003A7F213F